MPVTIVGRSPVCVVNAGDGPGTLVNRDLVNSVAIGPDTSIVGANPTSSSILDALVGMPVDGESDIYACIIPPSAAAVQLDFIQQAQAWNPSPKQSAQQLAAAGLALDSSVNNPAFGPAKDTTVAGTTGAVNVVNTTLGIPAQDASVVGVPTGIFNTGVPLYSKGSILLNHAAAAIAAGGTFTSANLPVSQIGYEFSINLTMGTATTPFASVTLTWTDSVSGKITSVEKWWLGAGTSPGIDYRGTGPTKGDTLVISVTNFDVANAMTMSCVAVQNSRVYVRDDWRQDVMKQLTGGVGGSLPNNDPPANLLCLAGPSIASAGNANRLLPLYCGNVLLLGFNGAQAGQYQIAALADQTAGVSNGIIYQRNIAASAIFVDQLCLPRSLCQLTIFNNGGGTATFNAAITVQEQPA